MCIIKTITRLSKYEVGVIIEGKSPKTKQKLVDAWIEIHRDELMADWELAINGEPVFKIAPLK